MEMAVESRDVAVPTGNTGHAVDWFKGKYDLRRLGQVSCNNIALCLGFKKTLMVK